MERFEEAHFMMGELGSYYHTVYDDKNSIELVYLPRDRDGEFIFNGLYCTKMRVELPITAERYVRGRVFGLYPVWEGCYTCYRARFSFPNYTYEGSINLQDEPSFNEALGLCIQIVNDWGNFSVSVDFCGVELYSAKVDFYEYYTGYDKWVANVRKSAWRVAVKFIREHGIKKLALAD